MASDIDSVVTVTDSDEDDDLEIVSVRPKSSTGQYYRAVECANLTDNRLTQAIATRRARLHYKYS